MDEDGHIVRRTEIHCPDDEAALGSVKNLADGHAVQLWEGSRCIALVDVTLPTEGFVDDALTVP